MTPPSVVDEVSCFRAANESALGIHAAFCWANGQQRDSWWRWLTAIGFGNEIGNGTGFGIEGERDSWNTIEAVDHRDWGSIQEERYLVCGVWPLFAEGLYPRGRTQILAECVCARIENKVVVGHWRMRAESESVRIVVRFAVVCGVGQFPS